MSEDIDKAIVMESFDEAEATVQVFGWVYDPEMLPDHYTDLNHSMTLVIYGGQDDSFAVEMRKFLHALTTGELDLAELCFDDSAEQYVTTICFRSKSDSNASD
jgi:hypothetical protein